MDTRGINSIERRLEDLELHAAGCIGLKDRLAEAESRIRARARETERTRQRHREETDRIEAAMEDTPRDRGIKRLGYFRAWTCKRCGKKTESDIEIWPEVLLCEPCKANQGEEEERRDG